MPTASTEIALQTVFDHAKSQLPEEIRLWVLQRWQYRGHGDTNNNGQPAVVDFIYKAFLTATQ